MAKTKTNQNDTPSWIVEHDGFAVIELHRPATFGGQKQTHVTMREPCVGDMKRVQNHKGGEADKEIFAIANLCEITPEEVEKLTLRNMSRVQAAFALFTD